MDDTGRSPTLLERLLSFRERLPPRLWEFLFKQYWATTWRVEHLKLCYQFRSLMPEVAGSERALLHEIVSVQYPFSSVLEFGCGYGSNLQFLAPRFPSAQFYGIDKNRDACEAFQAACAQKGLPNITLQWGGSELLDVLDAASIDVVFCSAVLLYVDAARIEDTLRSLLRVAARTLILVEQQFSNSTTATSELGVFISSAERGGGYWHRDYVQLLKRLAPDSYVTFKKVPRPLWKTEGWQRYGAVIRVDIGDADS